MQIEMGAFLVVARSVMLLVIAVTLCSYRDTSARHRPFVSVLACATAGASLAWGFYSVLMLPHQSAPKTLAEIWPTIFVMCTLVPVLCARGNVAKLLPRTKWLY